MKPIISILLIISIFLLGIGLVSSDILSEPWNTNQRGGNHNLTGMDFISANTFNGSFTGVVGSDITNDLNWINTSDIWNSSSTIVFLDDLNKKVNLGRIGGGQSSVFEVAVDDGFGIMVSDKSSGGIARVIIGESEDNGGYIDIFNDQEDINLALRGYAVEETQAYFNAGGVAIGKTTVISGTALDVLGLIRSSSLLTGLIVSTSAIIQGNIDISGNLTVEEEISVGTGTQWLNIYNNGTVGFINSTLPIIITNNFTISANSVLSLQANTSAVSCVSGNIYYDGDLNKHFGCNGTNWNQFY